LFKEIVMDIIIRKPRWDDADALISNYYSLLDEAKEDPFFGITQPPQRPDLPLGSTRASALGPGPVAER